MYVELFLSNPIRRGGGAWPESVSLADRSSTPFKLYPCLYKRAAVHRALPFEYLA